MQIFPKSLYIKDKYGHSRKIQIAMEYHILHFLGSGLYNLHNALVNSVDGGWSNALLQLERKAGFDISQNIWGSSLLALLDILDVNVLLFVDVEHAASSWQHWDALIF